MSDMQKQIKVLCAEDEHFISELYTRALSKADYNVTNIIDGVEALKEALTDKYDIILLDIMLPNKTGLEILDQIRKPGLTLHAKIIITTNLEQSEENRKAVEDKADGYVVKAEITPRQLVEYLDQLHIEPR